MSLDVYLSSPSTFNGVTSYLSHFDFNITHNLNSMAAAAGLYEALWYPEELGAKKAVQLIDVLTKGLEELKSKPGVYKLYNPENGWGDYEGLVDTVDRYLQACKTYPHANITISR